MAKELDSGHQQRHIQCMNIGNRYSFCRKMMKNSLGFEAFWLIVVWICHHIQSNKQIKRKDF
jgi:hypothetical protein